MIISLLKKVIRKFVGPLLQEPSRHRMVSLKTSVPKKGNVLLSYVLEPFILQSGEPISNAHTHDWESFQMANTFLELGYDVDIVDYNDAKFKPQRYYSIFVSARTHFQRIANLLNEDCIKIAHLDMAHWLFNNCAAYQRLLAFQKKKGITLTNIKFQEINWAIECADYATVLGNQFTIDTYRFSKKPIYRVPISTCATYPSPEKKNFDACRNNFIWMGSHGLVHKGLDRVLDAFVPLPNHHLYVLGPLDVEKDFVAAYYDELYNSPNIHTVGWVDVSGSQFTDLANQCAALVYPSCAEGGGGSVINCMHAGLIPIASYESSVDIGNFGIVLKTSSVDEIQNAVIAISRLPVAKLGDMAMQTWKFVNENHTREAFAKAYRRTIDAILKNCSSN